MAFYPNRTCFIRKAGQLDRYGQTMLGPSLTTRCAVVRLQRDTKKTSVRADSSASRGSAEEVQTLSKLLLASSAPVTLGDYIEINDFRLRVVTIQPRYNVAGALDHYEVECETWEDV